MVQLLIAYLAVTAVLAVLLLLVVAVQRLARIRHPVERRDVAVPTDQRPRALADHR